MRSPQTGLARPQNTLGDFRLSTIALLFVALIAAASIPVLTHQLPPLADYVNHLARTYVINAIDSDRDLARYYMIDWEIIPNLMIDLIVPVLNLFTNVYVAGQIFTVLTFIVIISGTLALNRALFGRWSALPLIAIPLLYNGVMLVGVMNYVFGIGLALWAFAAWIVLRDRFWPWRIVVSTLFVVALFFCHLFAAGLYGLELLAFELHRLWLRRAEPLRPRLIDFVATGIPFLAVLVLLVSGPTWTIDDAAPYWELEGKLDGVLLAVIVYYPFVAYGMLSVVAVAAAYAAYRGTLRIHPVAWAIFVVGGVIYLAMPRALFAAHLADQRLPIALAFMLVACLDIELRTRLARQAFVGLLVGLVAVRVFEVQSVWDHLAYRTDDFLRSVKTMERGARVLVVRDYDTDTGEISDNGLVHAASLATIERSALVTTAFTVKGKHILQVRDEFRKFVETEDQLPPSVKYFVQAADRVQGGASYFWNLWPRKYDYVYILLTKKGAQSPDRRHLTLVHEGPGFQLYRVKKTG
ncbi:MAG: hypothetical protein WD871_16290 [Xanthobacteraceae bacterium]